MILLVSNMANDTRHLASNEAKFFWVLTAAVYTAHACRPDVSWQPETASLPQTSIQWFFYCWASFADGGPKLNQHWCHTEGFECGIFLGKFYTYIIQYHNRLAKSVLPIWISRKTYQTAPQKVLFHFNKITKKYKTNANIRANNDYFGRLTFLWKFYT